MLDGPQRAVRRAWIGTPALLAILLLCAALPALASAVSITKFQHCPKENPEINTEAGACVYSKSQSNTSHWKQPVPPAELQAGNVTIPFVKPLVLQGGFGGLVEEPLPLVGPEDGAPRIVPVAQPVPGGLAGEIDPSKLHGATLAAYEEAIAHHKTKVTATIEVAPANAVVTLDSLNLLSGAGTFLTLPLKMKFSNAFLGEGCYAGSDEAPIVVELTDGTTAPPPPNEPISGQLGTFKFGEKSQQITIKEQSLVANGFEAPAVHGCGREAAWQEEVDEAINSKAGLPSPAGTNSTRINGTQVLMGVEALRAHGG
jgi:hypothetical protein